MRSLFPAILQLHPPWNVFQSGFSENIFSCLCQISKRASCWNIFVKNPSLSLWRCLTKNRSLFTLAALYRKPYFFITCFFTKNRASLLQASWPKTVLFCYRGPLPKTVLLYYKLLDRKPFHTFREACVAFRGSRLNHFSGSMCAFPGADQDTFRQACPTFWEMCFAW